MFQKIVVDAEEAVPAADVEDMEADEKELIDIFDATTQKKDNRCKCQKVLTSSDELDNYHCFQLDFSNRQKYNTLRINLIATFSCIVNIDLLISQH